MVNEHLSDEQIQELALNNNALSQDITAHAETCVACKLKIDTYRVMMSVIEETATPAFDFDLAAAVLTQIETSPPKSITKGVWWLFGIAIAAILVGVAIYFGEYMTEVYQGLKSLAIILVAISGVVLTSMLIIDQIKTYQQKMKMLDMR